MARFYEQIKVWQGGKEGKYVSHTRRCQRQRYVCLDSYVYSCTDNLLIVGFVGSGQAMRKDPTRSRHIYQQGEEEGY